MSNTEDRIPRHLLLPSVYEAEAAGDLLSCGIDLLRGAHGWPRRRWWPRRIRRELGIRPAAMFATLATGAEKMLKLSIGLLSVEEAGSWPSVRAMRDDLRHEIGLIHGQTLNDIRRRVESRESGGTAPGFVRDQLQQVHDDKRLHLIVFCLADYAKSGRFHNLDTLAGSEPPRPSPYELWKSLELDILKSEPELWATLELRST